MKVGIFGGSFNPPHKMHHQMALELLGKKVLDKIIFVPTGNNYQKKELIDWKHRYSMLEKICDLPLKMEVSDYECRGELTYTYQTLDFFQLLYPKDEIYFICGADNIASIETWRNYQYLLEKYSFLVIKRGEYDIKKMQERYPNARILCFDMDTSFVSSTFIRNLCKEDEDVSYYLDKKVWNYIQKNRLYKEEKKED